MKRNVVILSGTVDIISTNPIDEEMWVKTPYGEVFAQKSHHLWIINRHGKLGSIPPHCVNHRANLTAAKLLGNLVLGIGSVGSLDEDIHPNQLGVPNDIFHPFSMDTICGDYERIHAIPRFDLDLRSVLVSELTMFDFEVVDGGVYAQTRGPRFESQAEVVWLSQSAHYVGMTAASELTIASELEMPYALLVSVDNWANGIGGIQLTMEDFLSGVAQNHQMVRRAIDVLRPSLIELSLNRG